MKRSEYGKKTVEMISRHLNEAAPTVVKAMAWSIGSGEVAEIDHVNIFVASKRAMFRAVMKLPVKPDYVMVDALHLEDLPYPQQGIIVAYGSFGYL